MTFFNPTVMAYVMNSDFCGPFFDSALCYMVFNRLLQPAMD